MTTSEDVERAKREAVRGDVVTVRWVCSKTLFDRDSRVGTCLRAFTTTVTRADFNACEARARCPSCGGLLIQRSDGCELVSDPQSMMQAK